MSEREWHDGVVDVADELVKEYSAAGAIERLERRRETACEELRERCDEAIDYIEEVSDEHT